MKYGADGYAIYWYCLELIAGDLDGVNANFELSHDAEVIGYDLRIDQLRVEEIMRYMVDLQLFEASNGTVTCLKIAKFLDKKTTRNKDILAIIDKFNESKNVADKSGQAGDSPKQSRLDKNRLEENRLDIYNHTPEDSLESKKPTLAGLICRDLNGMGFTGINPSNPKFLAVLESGGTHAEFIDKAKVIPNDKKNFNYLIAAVIGERKNAGDIPEANKKPKSKLDKFL